MKILRRKSRQISVGAVKIGGNSLISIQSMTQFPAENFQKNIQQIKKLTKIGCQIIRIAIPDISQIGSFAKICQKSPIPVVADVHFDYKIAVVAAESGAAKIRVNPGNISEKNFLKIISAAKKNKIPIRIGVNAGSVKLNESKNMPKILAEAAKNFSNICEKNNFLNFCVSIKSSDVLENYCANKIFSEMSDAPIHLGITESGTEFSGAIASATGISPLLLEGIGDTIRISISGKRENEILVAKKILENLNLKSGPRVIACPTCGRTQMPVGKIAKKIEENIINVSLPVKIAVMGCAVNGPGEARNSDFAIIAAGKKMAGIFFRGENIINVEQKIVADKFLKIFNEKLNLL